MITAEEIERARTPRGGWTKEQLDRWGVPWPPPKGWKRRLLARCGPQASPPVCGGHSDAGEEENSEGFFWAALRRFECSS